MGEETLQQQGKNISQIIATSLMYRCKYPQVVASTVKSAGRNL